MDHKQSFLFNLLLCEYFLSGENFLFWHYSNEPFLGPAKWKIPYLNVSYFDIISKEGSTQGLEWLERNKSFFKNVRRTQAFIIEVEGDIFG
jgi:hypothetical protein